MEFNIYILIILLAAFSSFNMGLVYLVQSLRKKRMNFLATGLIFFSICLLASCYEISGWYKNYPAYIWWHVPLWYLIGPCLFWHVKNHIKWYDIFHALPAFYFLIRIGDFYWLPAQQKLSYYLSIYSPEVYEPDYVNYLHVFSIGLYALLGFGVLNREIKFFEHFSSDNSQKKGSQKIMDLYLIIGLVSLFSFVLSLIMDYSFNYFIEFDYISLSFLALLMILLQAYFTYFGLNFNPAQRSLAIAADKIAPNGDNRSDTDFTLLMNRLDQLMEKEKMYRRPDLKITEVAETLDVSMHELSAGINHYHKNNFFDYINRKRVEELKTTLLDPQNNHLTLFAIARNSGFKSSSSFYRVFKKYAGLTPKRYIEQQKDGIKGQEI